LEDSVTEADFARLAIGDHRLACPRCAESKHRARDDALSVTVKPGGGFVFHCWRCGWTGSARDGKAPAFTPGTFTPKSPAAPARVPANRAFAIWRAAGPAPAHHPYLLRKRLEAAGLRIVQRFAYSTTGALEHALLVPMRDESGRIVNLQGITGDGTKRFMAGVATRGAFACIGPWRRGVAPECLAIGEGWASVTSYHRMHLACLGVAAMSSGNLPTVARLFRAKYPNAEIVIVADQDAAGARAAGEATVAVNGVMHAPGFRFTGITDWNDLECKLRETE
jgi:hypothetical protein